MNHFLSGFIRLALNEYDDTDGRNRFESSLEKIKEIFNKEKQEVFLKYLIENLGIHLSEKKKEKLAISIIKHYPGKVEYLSEYYGLPYLLDDVYVEKINKLKILNKELYEQIREI